MSFQETQILDVAVVGVFFLFLSPLTTLFQPELCVCVSFLPGFVFCRSFLQDLCAPSLFLPFRFHLFPVAASWFSSPFFPLMTELNMQREQREVQWYRRYNTTIGASCFPCPQHIIFCCHFQRVWRGSLPAVPEISLPRTK